MKHARMKHPVMVLPDAMKPLQSPRQFDQAGGCRKRSLELVHLRASQINGCSVCVDDASEGSPASSARPTSACSPSRPGAMRPISPTPSAPRWRSPKPSRASPIARDPVPDAIWNEAARHYDERELATLILSIATINVWNRLNATIKMPVGVWKV